MFHTICNNKGVSLVEVLIAMAVVVIGIIGVLGVFAQGYTSSTKSDGIGRAAEILHRTLERAQLRIMNESCGTPTSSTSTVYSSGEATARPGDRAYNVTTTVTQINTNPLTWRVTVHVTWQGNPTGIRESLVVTRQSDYKTTSTTCS